MGGGIVLEGGGGNCNENEANCKRGHNCFGGDCNGRAQEQVTPLSLTKPDLGHKYFFQKKFKVANPTFFT